MKTVVGHLPSLNGLKAFEAAARHLNFRLAAEELGVTQGAVAQQVRGLEAELGVKLFERLPRQLALTSEGRGYIGDVRRAFELILRATGELRPQPVRLAISMTPTFASKWLVPRLPELTAAHPELDIHVVATDRVSHFQADGVDLAIRLGAPPFGAGLAAELLCEQVVIPVASPLLAEGLSMPATIEELLRHPLLHDAHNGWPDYVELLFGADAAQRVAGLRGIRFNQTAHAIDAAIAGQGIALAMRSFVARDMKEGRLVPMAEAGLRGASDFYLVWPRYRKSPALDAVRAWLHARAEEELR